MLGFDEYVSETTIVLDKHRNFEVLNGIKWYFIELPKFRKSNPDMNDKLNQWLAFIDNYDKELVKMAEKRNDRLGRAKIEMGYLTGDAELRRLTELREKWEMDYNSGISYAEERGKAEGLKENKIKTAKKLLKLNMPIEQIIEITELSKKEILDIKNNI